MCLYFVVNFNKSIVKNTNICSNGVRLEKERCILMLKCKINAEFNIYNIEQVFDKNINFKILLGGGGAFL